MKNKLIICTVGTSISNGCPSQRELLSKPTSWDDSIDSLTTEIQYRIDGMIKSDFRQISAEVNSIDRLGIRSGDRIVLLSSDNAPGRASSYALKRVISDYYNLPAQNIIIEKIEGLQVYDSSKLKKVGLKNFIATVLKYLDNKTLSYQYDVIINPTGGFKGVLPFLTILGMMYGKKTVYIFEFANELIFLPPMPFTFDLTLFERAQPALEYIEKEVAVSEQEYFSKIKNFSEGEQELFLSLVEPFENKLTISSLAYSFFILEKQSRQAHIYKKIADDLQKDNSLPGLALKRLINKVSSPLWRNNHSEHWYTSDLTVIKQKKTAERLAGFVKNNTFYVTHAFRTHKEYEQNIKGCSTKDYEDQNFSEWQNIDDVGVAEAGDEHGLIKERDRLLLEVQSLKKDVSSFKEKSTLLEIERDDLDDKLKNHIMDIVNLKSYNKKLNIENEELHNSLKYLKQRIAELESSNHGVWFSLKQYFRRNK